MLINIEKLTIDAGTQSRESISEEAIARYAEDMKNGDPFPPIRVITDGVKSYLVDGFHRYFAVKKLGKTSIEAEVTSGTLRDAILASTGANPDHGLPRTNADKRKSVTVLLDDFEWSDWSDSEIARQCKVSQPFVSNVRKGIAPDVVKYKGKGGAVHTRTRTSKVKPGDRMKPAAKDSAPDGPAHNVQDEVIADLTAQNEKLKDKLAVNQAPDPVAAETIIAELREENKRLHMELKTVKLSRDQFQNENAQLMKQVAALQRQLKKAA
jgi:FtsZ-binding cell division protein ZapB